MGNASAALLVAVNNSDDFVVARRSAWTVVVVVVDAGAHYRAYYDGSIDGEVADNNTDSSGGYGVNWMCCLGGFDCALHSAYEYYCALDYGSTCDPVRVVYT